MYDIVIVGAGPAGLTAALYALRANKKVLVLEAKTYGGQILNAAKVENYPGIKSISGFDFATELYNQVKDLDCEIKFESVIRIEENKTVVTNNNTYNAKTIILATGAENRKLNIENEKNLIGKGVSYCATCNRNYFKNKIVAVAGGENTALEDVVYLSDLAKKVYLIHRRDEFRGEKKYLEEVQSKENVEIILNSNVVKINGTEKVESIVIEDNNKNKTNIEIDGLFIAIGQSPKNQIFANIIELDEKGYIKSEDGVHTNIPKIYVAGDARVKVLRQLTTAVSDGSIAAVTAIKEMED